MRKLWVVASREYRTTIKSKTFLIVMGLMPIFMLGSLVAEMVMKGRVDVVTKKIAVVDHSGKLFEALRDAAQKRNDEEVHDSETGRQIEPEFELLETPPAEDGRDEQLLELSERIRKKELFAFIEIGGDILGLSSPSDGPGIHYYSNQPTYRDVYRWLRRVINARVQTARLAEAHIDMAVVQQAMMPVSVENLGLLERGESGEIVKAEEVDMGRTLLPALGLIMLMWMSLVITVQPLLNCVLEEKMQRIAEVLLGSVGPFELMAGKLLGYVLVSLTMVAVYVTGGYFVAHHFGHADTIPFHLMGWFVVFQSLAILMFGSMFLAAGSCCNDLREAQNLVMPIWLPMIIPFFFLSIVMQHPDSNFAIGLSLFPPATPMLMLLRMSLPPTPPLWQPIVGVVGTLLTTVVCVWLAGRIFRVGLLLSGKPPKFTQMLRWVVRG